MTRPKGLDKHLRRLNQLSGNEVRKIAGAAVFEASDDIRVEAFRSISAGAVSGAGHVASRPGEPPNRDTGDLQAGLENLQTGPLSAEVRANAPHSAPLEFSTSKMAARPFMRPARDKKLPDAQKRLADQLDKLVKRSG
ncbi:HK97 gp10 family phage protein [Erythrobacter sp. SCSIO 43205]|uniref:HK97 gp10 family phage protein n=1 Tax=Erythrobacter sp. SCSIO 43205 TaxID=2779361 RepID=UPI001CA9F5D4|nr:HK97 gp10 family phage protein [Erythrobacter sp. SCSIO 43205]UAB76962.1 HK97 gp10 family phage protein [Erythrobacter sp. SCSIO 43205]